MKTFMIVAIAVVSLSFASRAAAADPVYIYDPMPGHTPTMCAYGGTMVHCCPSGYAMQGMNLNANILMCAPISRGNQCWMDGPGQAQQTHDLIYQVWYPSPPYAQEHFGTPGPIKAHYCTGGGVLVGLNAGADQLYCCSSGELTQPGVFRDLWTISPVDPWGNQEHMCPTFSSTAHPVTSAFNSVMTGYYDPDGEFICTGAF